MSPVRCIVCDEGSAKGINLLGIHICKNCLDEITNININDIRYEYYKSVIKKTWIDYIVTNS